MTVYQEAMEQMDAVFGGGKDNLIAFATITEKGLPAVRTVGCFL